MSEAREPYLEEWETCCPFFKNGHCRYATHCNYAHDISKPTAICKFYATGECNFGDKCFFRHAFMAPEPIAAIAPAPASYRPLQPPAKPPVPTPQDYVTSFLRFKEQIWAEICEENDLDPSTSNLVDFPDLWQDAFRTALEDADWYEQSHIFLKVSWRNYCMEWTPNMWEQVAQECEIQGLVKWQLPIAQAKSDCQATCLLLQELLALAKHAAFDVGRDSGEWAEDTGDGMNWEYSRIKGYIVAGAARRDWVLAKRLLETHVWDVPPLFDSGQDDYGIDIDFDDDEEMPMVAHGAQAFCADVLTAVLCSNASDEDIVELISGLLPEDCSDWECSSMSDTAFLAVSQACQAMRWGFDDDDRKDQAEEIGEFAWVVTVKAALPYAAQDPYLDLSEELGWVGWVCDALKKVCRDLCLGWQPEDKLLYWKAALNDTLNAGDYATVGKWVAQETGARTQRQQGSKRRAHAYDLELYHGRIVLNEEEFTRECKPKPRILSLQTLAGKKNQVVASTSRSRGSGASTIAVSRGATGFLIASTTVAPVPSAAPLQRVPWPKSSWKGGYITLRNPAALDDLLSGPVTAKDKVHAIALGEDFGVNDGHVDTITRSFGQKLLLLTMGSSDSGDGYHLTNAAVDLIIQRCPNLVELQLNAATRITDVAFLKILKELPRLQVLGVTGHDRSQGHITDKGFKALLNLQTAPLLQTLYITDQRIGYDLVMKVIKVRKKGGLKVQAGETDGDSMAASMVRSEMGMGWGDGIYGNMGGDDFDDDYY